MLSLGYNGSSPVERTRPISYRELKPKVVYRVREEYAGTYEDEREKPQIIRLTGETIKKRVEQGYMHAMRKYYVDDGTTGTARLLDHLTGHVSRIMH